LIFIYKDVVKAFADFPTQGWLTDGFKESELIQLRHLCLRLTQAMSTEEAKTHATS